MKCALSLNYAFQQRECKQRYTSKSQANGTFSGIDDDIKHRENGHLYG